MDNKLKKITQQGGDEPFALWHRLKKARQLKRRKQKQLHTVYTGLIKSTADLAFWANQKPFYYRCAKCKTGIEKQAKCDNRGLCDDCRTEVRENERCIVCFEKITNQTHRYEFGNACRVCVSPAPTGGNHHGYKEGGKLSGGLRTNYWVDNENDDIAKILEK